MRIAPGGWRWTLAPLAIGAGLLFVSPPASALALLLAGGVLAFFRDPEREPPTEGVLSPADGKVSVLRREGDRLRVGVYMNVADVHVNRAPVGGTVTDVTHEPGAHRPAFTKDSDRNEQVHVRVDGDDGEDYEVTLIAGWVARRITPYVEGGEPVDRGERLGHIAFGSRADVLLPASFDEADLRVAKGERVRAGETVLAEW